MSFAPPPNDIWRGCASTPGRSRRGQGSLGIIERTVILTPFAMLLAVGILVITIQWFGTGGGWLRYRSDWIVGISVANMIMAYLVLSTAGGHWRSRWVQGGAGAYVAMLALTYGPELDAASLAFLAPWALLAVVSLTLISQAHEDTPAASSSVVAAIPNLILGAYRDIFRDLLSLSRGGHDAERAIAMLQAAHTRDAARQRQLLLAATRRGIELRREVIRAKLVREYRDELLTKEANPPLFLQGHRRLADVAPHTVPLFPTPRVSPRAPSPGS